MGYSNPMSRGSVLNKHIKIKVARNQHIKYGSGSVVKPTSGAKFRYAYTGRARYRLAAVH